MPVVDFWFDDKKSLDWKPRTSSPIDPSVKGPVFFEYPLCWVIPTVRLKKSDLKNAPTNVWITGIDRKSKIGKIDNSNLKEYIVDLPENFNEYLAGVQKKRRKKFKYILRKNSDIRIVEDNFEDLKKAWKWFVKKIDELNMKEGEDPEPEEDWKMRWELFHSKNTHTLSFYLGEELVGVNVSMWVNSTIYDLAFLRKENAALNKRALGFYAILQNINLGIARGLKVYDLLNGDFPYKAEFATRMAPLKQYIRCTEEFAKAYDIPLDDICELVDEKEIEEQLHPAGAMPLVKGPSKPQKPQNPKSIIAPMQAKR
ncbi:MAG: GNAT family N-acetyltransferase [Candidatus Diapherotrites archaeon]|nr:GNAT family N-acetyltransferase [Candidatus Diapherotrites archaeon]